MNINSVRSPSFYSPSIQRDLDLECEEIGRKALILTEEEQKQNIESLLELVSWSNTVESSLRASGGALTSSTSPTIKRVKMIYDSTKKKSSTPAWTEITSLIPDLMEKIKKENERKK